MKILYCNSIRKECTQYLHQSSRVNEHQEHEGPTSSIIHPKMKRVRCYCSAHFEDVECVERIERKVFITTLLFSLENIFFSCGAFCLANDISKDDGMYNAMSLQIRTLLKRLTSKTPSFLRRSSQLGMLSE